MKRPSLHHHTTHTRDAALQRLTRINRWLIMGSIVLTALLADVAANAFPGHKKTSAAAASRRETKSRPTGVLAPPGQAPESSSGAGESDPPSEGSAGEDDSGAESSPSSEAQTPETSSAPEASEEPSSTESAPSEPSGEASEPVVSGGS